MTKPGEPINILPTAAGFGTPGRVRILSNHVVVNFEMGEMDHGRKALWEFLEFAEDPTDASLLECVEAYGVFGLGRAYVDPEEQLPLQKHHFSAFVHAEPIAIWVGIGTIFSRLLRAHDQLSQGEARAALRSAIEADALLDWVVGIAEQEAKQRQALSREPWSQIRNSPVMDDANVTDTVVTIARAAENLAASAEQFTQMSAREQVATVVDGLIKLAGLGPRMRPDTFAFEMYSKGSFLLGHLVMELMAVLGGSRSCGICASCGKPMSMARRSRTGRRRTWCSKAECQLARNAAASAAYRGRMRKKGRA